MVVQLQHGVVLLQCQVEQRPVPLDVEGEVVAPRPAVSVFRNPCDPDAWLVAHFHHMGHRVKPPGVAGLHLQGIPPGALGRIVLARLLQAEGVAAQDKGIVRDARPPAGQHPGGRRVHADGVAGHKPECVAQLDRQRVDRVVGDDFLQPDHRHGQIARAAGGQGVDIFALSRGAAPFRQAVPRRGQGPIGDFVQFAAAEQLLKEPFGRQCQRHVGIGIERRGEIVCRRVAVAQKARHSPIEAANDLRIARSYRQIPTVNKHWHCLPTAAPYRAISLTVRLPNHSTISTSVSVT